MTRAMRWFPTTLLAVGLSCGAIGCGSSDDGSKDKTATVTVAAPPVTTPAVTATTPVVEPPVATTTTPQRSAVTRSGNGKTYRCVGDNLLADLHRLDKRIAAGRRVLKRIRSELRKTKRKYPSNVAPPRVAQRYNFLVRKYNGQVKVNRHRIRVYNHTLDRECTRS